MCIIDGFDISTEKGCKEFNEKFTDFKASINKGGGFTLEGLKKQEHLIYYDGEKEMFTVEKIK
mgnify:FL=1|tara:strand:+ start:6933 stop:7121 length:189 start_codon:yes stop_codon:yes gene_type:complete